MLRHHELYPPIFYLTLPFPICTLLHLPICTLFYLPYLYSAGPPGPQIQQDPGPGDLTLLSHGASRPHVGVVRVVDRERVRERERENL